MRSTIGKVLLGIGSFGSLIAIALFFVLLITFERISEEFWREKAHYWGPVAAPTFWWRAIAKPREHNALPENYRPPTSNPPAA